MYLSKSLSNYVKSREKNATLDVVEIRNALTRSGYTNYIVFSTEKGELVLLDTSKNIDASVIMKNGAVQGFTNSDDFQAVTTGAYARLNILNSISNDEDLQAVKNIFKKKRTWVIHQLNRGSEDFEAHTHGMANYSHLDFRIKKDIGEEDIAYLFNSLCKSVQMGNSFKDGDRVENLYENCDIILRKSADDLLEVSFIGA